MSNAKWIYKGFDYVSDSMKIKLLNKSSAKNNSHIDSESMRLSGIDCELEEFCKRFSSIEEMAKYLNIEVDILKRTLYNSGQKEISSLFKNNKEE